MPGICILFVYRGELPGRGRGVRYGGAKLWRRQRGQGGKGDGVGFGGLRNAAFRAERDYCQVPTAMKRSAGIEHRCVGSSLVEMLVACALLAMLLAAAAGVHAEARMSAAATEDIAQRGQLVELASELLHYHIGLAGHRGLSDPLFDLAGPALSFSRGASQGGNDLLAVRYAEERWYQPAQLRALNFDVKRDSRGLWNLYQREEGATRQPAVQQVDGLKVTSFIAHDGSSLPADSPLPLDAVGIEMLLGFTWGETRPVTILFGGVQRVEAGP